MPVGTFMTVKCGRVDMTLKESLIQHRQASFGIYAARAFRNCTVLDYYCGPLVYPDPFGQQNTALTFDEQLLDGEMVPSDMSSSPQ